MNARLPSDCDQSRHSRNLPALSRALIRTYGWAQAHGLLSGGTGRCVYEWAYDFYKEWIEAGAIDQLRAFAVPGSTVIDVGANVGFFTRRFATWTGPDGKVIALEPEALNVARLRDVVARAGLKQVQVMQAVAADFAGTAILTVNPYHPGDHKLGETGVAVDAVRLDDISSAHVSLVKIDVQGAEMRVLKGAERLLREVRPVWLVEIDDANLRAMGSSAKAVLRFFVDRGYTVHRLGPEIGPALSVNEILSGLRPGAYEDLLFKPGP